MPPFSSLSNQKLCYKLLAWLSLACSLGSLNGLLAFQTAVWPGTLTLQQQSKEHLSPSVSTDTQEPVQEVPPPSECTTGRWFELRETAAEGLSATTTLSLIHSFTQDCGKWQATALAAPGGSHFVKLAAMQTRERTLAE